jgi:hypothetical protein
MKQLESHTFRRFFVTRLFVLLTALLCILATVSLSAQGDSQSEMPLPSITGVPVETDPAVLRRMAEALQERDCNGRYRYLDQPISVVRFVGGLVKEIHLVRFTQFGNPPAVEVLRKIVGKVWHGKFQSASCMIDWDEGASWPVEAVVEFYDGTESKIFSDGSHVAFQDHDGHGWFVRLLPSAQ